MRPEEIRSSNTRHRTTTPIRLFTLAALLAIEALFGSPAHAAGPRWVTGQPYFVVPAGKPVVWQTTHLQYFTDAADLSAYVNHAAADSLVAAAASVWNIPTSTVVLSSGGTLDEHVSSANTSMSPGGPVFPTDVQSSNYATRPIAVLYDSDGSLTDMLLGPRASDPAQCLQNGVTEDVDSITPFGYIQHAVLILNGRCTGPAPEQQLQMQYQLQRAFGRILGLAWSQVNDNVFTGQPSPTDTQKLHWPIMHPIDRVCGQYTYQCLPQPFTLRDDDVASISSLYPVLNSTTPGKTPTWQNAARITGTISFPTGEGMQGVNVAVRRISGGSTTPQDYYDTSSVSGFLFQRNAGNAVTGAPSSVSGSMGSADPQFAGYYDLAWVPQTDPPGSNGPMSVAISTEPINPLYIGKYAVGPYVPGVVSPSGSVQSAVTDAPSYDGSHPAVLNFSPSDAASDCTTADGTETSPNSAAPTGLWSGLLCAHGHSAWSSLSVAAQRTATIEVTATDETDAPTTAKSMPVLGVWSRADLAGMPPTLAATPVAFNTIALGVSAARLYSPTGGDFRFVIADQRGDGRPDFTYNARVLYAATLQPTTIPLTGGQITIAGMGFTPGLQIQINNTAATVLQTTTTSLVVTAPAASIPGTVDLVIKDPATGGTTSMIGALTYSAAAQPNRMVLISAPSGTVTVGSPAPAAFAVRVLQSDGITPVAGAAVTFSVASGTARLGACQAITCVVSTDSSGVASTSVTPLAAGTISLNASVPGASQTVSFNAALRTLSAARPIEYVAADSVITLPVQVIATQNGVPAIGIAVSWTSNSALTFSPALSTTDGNGVAQSAGTIGALNAGSTPASQACGWTAVCTSLSFIPVDRSAWRVELVSGGAQTVSSSSTFTSLMARIVDPAGHPIAGAPVAIHQTVNADSPPCPPHGACPTAPSLDSSTSSAVSDADGLITIKPMQMPGIAETTQIVIASGTFGFLPLTLQQTP